MPKPYDFADELLFAVDRRVEELYDVLPDDEDDDEIEEDDDEDGDEDDDICGDEELVEGMSQEDIEL